MTARRLRKCPTCLRPLDEETRAAMGLRTGEVLNALCPGYIGPSDIDHVLHNGRHQPEELVMFLEYKNGAEPPRGQAWLLHSLSGDWQERNGGRLLTIRRQVLPQHPLNPEELLRPIVDWVFPGDG